ncbi:ephrin-B2-like [Coccinella septempunctata]|uniref:ephrin-B2-like n=1 Tax=Coccinella septempunctata TaxID=41139 RepID=UPI001D06901B|nr:ephrin-B2-like [Coccinella septempunctata]XP_044745450.1 ephrin-B2-like [Coccinella septempunctata]
MMFWNLGVSLTHCLILVLLLTIQTILALKPGSARLMTIHWNSTNPIFRIDNTDNIIDVNKNNLPFEYDQVDLICPVYTQGSTEKNMEKYIIYNVSKDEYETCRIVNPNPSIIAVCDKPYKLMYFTITFRPFTPQPGGLEFHPGHDYYFISTSSNDDLHRRIGGKCDSHNMKIVFKVWDSKAATTSTHNPLEHSPTWWTYPSWRTTTTTARPTTTRPSTTTKKSKPHKKKENEVVKSELTLGANSSSVSAKLLVLCVLFSAIVAMR